MISPARRDGSSRLLTVDSPESNSPRRNQAGNEVDPQNRLREKKRPSSPSSDASGPSRRRRIILACHACGWRKTRCDGSRPECSLCKRVGLDCVYSEPDTKVQNVDADQAALPRSSQSPPFLGPPPPLSTYSPPNTQSNGFYSSDITPPPLRFRDDSPRPTASTPPIFATPLAPPPQNEYTYICIGSEQVRLLLLSKGRYEEPVHCSLKVMHISRLKGSQLGYQALSYAWGEDDAKHEIFLKDVNVSAEGLAPEEIYRLATAQAVPRRFYVRYNLYQALKRIRSETTDLWFWIDAVCINQENDVEKSHQLAKMLDIYYDGHHAMDFIPSIVNLKLLDRMVAGEGPDKKTAISWVAFANLLRRPWFRRRWVIQEVASSRRASVQCGKKSINWIDFADAVQLFIAKVERIRAIYDSSELSKQDPDALSHVESVGATAIVSTTNNVLRKAESGMVLDRLLNIESLVMTFPHFEASDPRDTIYALLSLASDGHMSIRGESWSSITTSLVPDYTKSALQIYMEFVQHCIVSSGSLDIICRHWALPLTEREGVGVRTFSASSSWPQLANSPVMASSFPSWIGLVTNSPFGPPSRCTGRLNGDILVGEPGRRIYNASRGRLAEIRFGKINSPEDGSDRAENTTHSTSFNNAPFDGTLYAKGISLSRISRVSSRVVDGTISDDCLWMAGWNGEDDVNNIPDRLWRTIVADRASDGKNTPFWYRRACMYCLKKTNPNGDLNTSKLIANRSFPETVIEYLKRIQAIVWSRKFLVSQSLDKKPEWLFGLGSRYIKEADLVCILFGCSVPVILRKHREDTGASYFEFIGECYIHGKMDGEALACMDEVSIIEGTVEFNIR
ncbi:hypothetical protein K469DRAFT_752834 [Zopfia rhizophila CBS 207.26]|uniref:Zn(2)-C6 fungal-type domain-containing protein n=1 Tax=Zopfia rhizophila CBS 207.26 TaxID=1314779 RepID=A0A6A6DSC0_9PEZI|nr:hypothetical protein K469DRAFT_752834 [Zopfia rhizophila CBS 207.26]